MHKCGIIVAPTFFDVPPETKETYGIQNPGMGHFGRPDQLKTFQEWCNMRTVLQQQLGIFTHLLEPDPDLFDMVFACDPGLWISDGVNNIFIEANFSVPRHGEVLHFRRWMHHYGIKTVSLSRGARFEGGDCVPIMNGKEFVLVLFYGETRTNSLGVVELRHILEPLGIKVAPIRRVTTEFYHGNSVATIYPGANLFTFYAPAFEPNAKGILTEHLSQCEVVDLPEAWLFGNDPDLGGVYLYLFGLNQIEQRGISLTTHCHDDYADFLIRRGITPVVSPTPELKRSRGSHRCSVNLQYIVTP